MPTKASIVTGFVSVRRNVDPKSATSVRASLAGVLTEDESAVGADSTDSGSPRIDWKPMYRRIPPPARAIPLRCPSRTDESAARPNPAMAP
ncbi:hypothetical protein C457_06896 [Haloferax prahovense DSM 18310]|uniref:Uncharacterized protein n=1 Tax=Haloferax prahovense (strain DSM 18310 / JCM 13924 / TL6) TaxID=1227461 RepID=M0GHL8_HALPT|nr:hypothetical protein C457_06896 [Haloferax prahovense DSM 18310]